MTVRFTRVFGLYTFFSVFLPGITFLFLLTPLFSILAASTSSFQYPGEGTSQLLTIGGVLVFITLGLFVGFGLHTLGAWFEIRTAELKFLPDFFDDLATSCVKGYCIGNVFRKFKINIGKPHRVLFYETLNGSSDVIDSNLVEAFLENVDDTFAYLDLDRGPSQSRLERTFGLDGTGPFDEVVASRARTISTTSNPANFWRTGPKPADRLPDGADDSITERESKALYTLVRGLIHMDQSGRSRTFQAVSASCRSMVVASFLLMVSYTAYLAVAFIASADEVTDKETIRNFVEAGIFRISTPVYVPFETLDGISAAFLLTVIVGFLGVYFFSGVARVSKHHYLEYLIGDFLLLVRTLEKNEQSEPDSQPTRLHSRPRIQRDWTRKIR